MRYSTYFTVAQAGQIATSSSRDTITMPNDVTPLDFGVPVTIKNTTTVGSNPVVIKGGSEDDIIGVSIFKQPTEAVISGSTVTYQYKPNEPVGIITDGSIYVIASVDVSAFDDAYIDVDGKFTNMSTDNARFGKFMTRGQAGELVVLEFDIHTYNISSNNIVTPSGQLIAPNHDETYEDTAGEPGEIYYRTGSDEVIRAYTGSITNGTWNTVLTSSDPDGYLIVKSSDTDPSLASSGQIYYNTADKTIKTYLGEVRDSNGQITTPGTWHTIATDIEPNQDDNLIALNHTDTPTTSGIIYYNNNLLKTHDYNSTTQTIVTTPDVDGNLVVKSSDTDPSPASSGQIYYNTTDKTLKTYLGEVRDSNGQITTPGTWHTIATDIEQTENGDLIALNHTDTPTTSGIIYYNNNLPRTRDYNNVTQTIVTTPDVDGNLVARTHTGVPTTPGIIYYNNNHLRTHYNSTTQTIITTPDPLGNIVVKSSNTSLNVPQTPGLIYYDDSQGGFMGYMYDIHVEYAKLVYLGPKPTISYADTTLSEPGYESKYETILLENKAWTPLVAYNLPAGPGRITQNHNFLFTTSSNASHGNGFTYLGFYPILTTIMVSISGYTTSSSHTTIEFEARNVVNNSIPGSRVSMNLLDNDRPATVTMIFPTEFSNGDSFRIYVRHTSSNSSIPFYTTNFSASSITF